MIFNSQSDFEKANSYKGLDLDSSLDYMGTWDKTKNTVSFVITTHTIPFSSFSTMAQDLNINFICEFTYMIHHIKKEPDLIVEIKGNGEMIDIQPEAKTATESLVLSDQELLSSPLMIEPLEFDNKTISPEQKSIKIQKDMAFISFISDILLNIILAGIGICSIATIIELITNPTRIKTTKDIIVSITSMFPEIIIILIPLSLIFGAIFWVNDVVDHIIRPIFRAIFPSKYQKQLDFNIFSRNINELRDIVKEKNIGGLKSDLPLVSSWSDFFIDEPVYNENIKYRLFYLIDIYAMDSFLEISNNQNPELMDELLKPFMISILRDIKNKYDKHVIFEKQYQEKKEHELKEKIKQDIEIFENNH